MFKEKDGLFSWRKGLTAIAGFCFAYVVIMYELGFPEIPKAYLLVISGVFGFYFTKELFTKNKKQ